VSLHTLQETLVFLNKNEASYLSVIVLVVDIIHEIKILAMSCTSVIQVCNVAWGNYEFNASQLQQGA
jgi:hypothetical protein